MGCGILDHADGMFAVCGGEATPIKTMEEGAKIIRKWAAVAGIDLERAAR
jgi:hypothetical protein